MKLLTIGIDGGDRRILEAMPMPFLHGLLKSSQAPALTGDLYSRGWAEIYTGRHCLETGALYMHPKLDGTRAFTQSYNYKVSADAGIPMLWDVLNKGGHKVGFMNIPTSSPSPEVDGFFVGGGGGGISKTDGVPLALCDSEETRRDLEELDYVADLRLGGDSIGTLSEMFDRLDAIIKLRRDAFLALCEKHKPDFGFLCYRVTTTVQYVAMSEIEAMLAADELAEIEAGGQPGEPALNPAQKRIRQHYALLDDMLREVFGKLQPEEWLFCADHGASQYKYDINANAFLLETGYQVGKSKATGGGLGKLRLMRNTLRKALPKGATKAIRGSGLSNLGGFLGRPFDPTRTKAFGHWYVQGIYINDKRRFDGPVGEGEELDRLVDEICEAFNEHADSKKFHLRAVPYRRNHLESPWADKLPDIMVEKPDEMFFGRQEGFVCPNPNYGPIPEDISGLGDMNSGQKSSHPLFAVSEGLLKHIQDGDERAIPLVFKVIARHFGVPER